MSSAKVSFGCSVTSPCGLSSEPVPVELFRPARPHEESHVTACLGQAAAEIAASRPGSHEKNAHPLLLSTGPPGPLPPP